MYSQYPNPPKTNTKPFILRKGENLTFLGFIIKVGADNRET